MQMDKLYVKDEVEWRDWLARFHDREKEIWLVFYKKESKKTGIGYEQAVEEALCFGWVDSLIKSLDTESYARKFTPRKENSIWSESNKRRVKKLIKEGKMMDIGLAKIEAAKKSGWWDKDNRPVISLDMPPAFRQALNANKRARANFSKLAETYQKHYIIWIGMAKRTETRERRISESIALLEKGQKLGLK
jgi:uncharacterized protein YdeI (YjbR/CyaY-like superfamily)